MRYILFAGENYYPSGGADDMIGFYATIHECIVAYGNTDDAQWFNVIDTKEQKELEVPRHPFHGDVPYIELLDWAIAEDLERSRSNHR